MNDYDMWLFRRYYAPKQVVQVQGKPKKRRSCIGAVTAQKNALYRRFANGGIPPRMAVKKRLTEGVRRFE